MTWVMGIRLCRPPGKVVRAKVSMTTSFSTAFYSCDGNHCSLLTPMREQSSASVWPTQGYSYLSL